MAGSLAHPEDWELGCFGSLSRNTCQFALASLGVKVARRLYRMSKRDRAVSGGRLTDRSLVRSFLREGGRGGGLPKQIATVNGSEIADFKAYNEWYTYFTAPFVNNVSGSNEMKPRTFQ